MEERIVRVIQSNRLSMTLSVEVYYYMLMQVPKGYITRYEDITQYLAKEFYVDFVDIDHSQFLIRSFLDPGYSMQVYDIVPMYREVTTGGRTDFKIELQNEGFVILPPLMHQRSERVKDFKKYLFDFSTLNIDRETLKDINKNGLKKYLPEDDKYKFSQDEILNAYMKVFQ